MSRTACTALVLLLAATAVAASGRAVAGSTALQLNPNLAHTTALKPASLARALSHDVEDDTAKALAAIHGDVNGKECKMYCEGKEVGKGGSVAPGEVKDCWGDFKIFCKWSKNGTENEDSACGVVGLKCEGHWIYMPKEDYTIVVCDGLLKKFSKTAVTSASGEGATIFKAGGCLGTGIGAVAKRGNASAAVERAFDELPTDALISKSDHFLEDKNLAAAVDRLWADSDSSKTLFEARCDGPGGKVLAVRKHEAGAAPTAESLGTFEDNEREAVKAVKDFEFPKPPKAAHKDHAHHHLHMKHLFFRHMPFFHHGHRGHGHKDGAGKDITCVKLCNGKTPWFHGALPCFGVASLHCYGTFDPSNLLSGHGHHCGGKKNHAKQHAEHQAEKHADAIAVVVKAGAAPTAVGEPFKFDFSASCKGAFTGIFGAKCYGFASEHQHFSQLDKYEYCTGTHGMRVKMRPGAFAMGKWCKGKSLAAVQKPEEDSAAGAQQAEMTVQ